MGVIVVAHAHPVAGRDLGRSVELVGDLRHVIRRLPAVRSNERVDDRLDAEFLRFAEDLVQVAADEALVRGRSGQAALRQSVAQRVAEGHEGERLDLGEADVRDPLERADRVFGQELAHRIQLNGDF